MFQEKCITPMLYTSIKKILWSPKKIKEKLSHEIKNKYKLNDYISFILSARFNSILDIERFFDTRLLTNFPNPYHLKDMQKGVDRLFDAINNKERICIYGDYDVDGGTATAVIYKFLKHLNIKAKIYIPDRLKEGYGLNINAIKFLSKENIQLIITVDTGTTALKEIACATSLNIDTIIIDHHISNKHLPTACAIINPNRLDELSDHKNLSAVGVAFLFLVAVRSKIKKKYIISDEFLFSLLDLVAIGTICDVVPVNKLNRVLITQGLKIINHNNIGIQALIKALNIHNTDITPEDIGFFIGPVINAGSRIENSYLAVNLLISENQSQSNKEADYLVSLNNIRKEIEHKMYLEATSKITNLDNKIILLHEDNWHIGVIGVIAGKLKEDYNKPVIICSFNEKGIGTCSCRSVPSFNIGGAILQAKEKELIISGGGHSMAAGFSITKNNIQKFNIWINDIVNNSTTYKEEIKEFDLIINTTDITFQLIQSLKILEPYGNSNSEPIFLIQNLYIIHTKIIGNNKHISCKLQCKNSNKIFNAIAFKSTYNSIGKTLLNNYEKSISIITKLRINHYQNKKTIQFLIIDLI